MPHAFGALAAFAFSAMGAVGCAHYGNFPLTHPAEVSLRAIANFAVVQAGGPDAEEFAAELRIRIAERLGGAVTVGADGPALVRVTITRASDRPTYVRDDDRGGMLRRSRWIAYCAHTPIISPAIMMMMMSSVARSAAAAAQRAMHARFEAELMVVDQVSGAIVFRRTFAQDSYHPNDGRAAEHLAPLRESVLSAMVRALSPSDDSELIRLAGCGREPSWEAGVAEIESGHFDDAERDFRDAVRRLRDLPRSAPAYFNLGLVLEHSGRFLEARHAIQRAIELNPRRTPWRHELDRVSTLESDAAEVRAQLAL